MEATITASAPLNATAASHAPALEGAAALCLPASGLGGAAGQPAAVSMPATAQDLGTLPHLMAGPALLPPSPFLSPASQPAQPPANATGAGAPSPPAAVAQQAAATATALQAFTHSAVKPAQQSDAEPVGLPTPAHQRQQTSHKVPAAWHPPGDPSGNGLHADCDASQHLQQQLQAAAALAAQQHQQQSAAALAAQQEIRAQQFAGVTSAAAAGLPSWQQGFQRCVPAPGSTGLPAAAGAVQLQQPPTGPGSLAAAGQLGSLVGVAPTTLMASMPLPHASELASLQQFPARSALPGLCPPATMLQASAEAAGVQQLTQQLAAAALGMPAGGMTQGLTSFDVLPATAAHVQHSDAAASRAMSAAGSSVGQASTTASRDSAGSMQLAQAAAATRQVAAQKQGEQAAAAAAYQLAASQAAAATDTVTASWAAAAAQRAAAAFSTAGDEAAAAQEASMQLQQAAAVTAAAEASQAVAQLAQAAAATQQVATRKQAEQAAAAAAYQVAANEAAAATDAVSAGRAVAAAQQAAQAFSAAATEAAQAEVASAQLQKQAAAAASAAIAGQQLDRQGGVAAPTYVHLPSSTPVAVNSTPSPAAAQLAGAAAAAQQVHAQKAAEQQAAATQYNAATSQVAAATSLQEQAHAAVAVQQAVAAYTAAASEAAMAESAAQQLHRAAMAAAAVPVPLHALASAPLAAIGAAGMPLPSRPATVPAAPALLPGQPPFGASSPALGFLPAAAAGLLGGCSSSAGSGASAQRQPFSFAAASPAAVGPAALPLVPTAYLHPPGGTLLHPGELAPAAAAGAAASAAQPAAPVSPGPFALMPTRAAATPAGSSAGHPDALSMPVHWPPCLSSKSGGSARGRGAESESAPCPPPAFPRVSAWSQEAAGIGRTCKVVCSSGGSFCKQQGSGAWDYEGGETRLVSVPFHCDRLRLLEALERAVGPAGGRPTTSAESASDAAPRDLAPQLKYRLPSDPSLWVDLLDDEDVALMFDEFDEHRNGGSAPAKLHLFVQWQSPAAVHLPDSADQDHLHSGPHVTSDSQTRHVSSEQTSGALLQPMAGRAPSPAAPATGGSVRGGAVDLCALVDKMEIIDPADMHLLRFLGAGGYGDVYLARWHGSEVAVKCLNPSLFFGEDECSSVNRGAIVDLIREADLLSCMRHPNVVWVYGIVLPPLPDEEQEARGPGQAGSDSDSAGCAAEGGSKATDRAASGGASSSASRPKSDVVDVIASGIRRSGVAPGGVRPPALVTEYMAGGSLKMALARRADMVAAPLTRVVLALDAAKGMEYLHSKSLVHFDLKTANLLLGYRDRRPICKVADFGLSKQKMDTFVTGVSSQRGTLPWTAPEILRTPEAVTEKVDVFSFGIVMWELDTGLEPYHGQNYHALLLRLANPREQLRPPLPGGPDWEGDVPSELAPGWRALMQRCWAEDPTCRPPFSEIIQELRCMASALKANRNSP